VPSEEDTALDGVGIAFTLGSGNDLVCKAIEYLSEELVGGRSMS
jgi:L-fuconate dehydratase